MPTKSEHDYPNLEIRWKMFRGFKDTGWLEIRPLTILLGANSSGKTSLLAPLLLMKQTLESPGLMILSTKGELVDVGRFTDMAYRHNRKATLFFGIRFHTHNLPSNKRERPLGAYPAGALELNIKAGKSPRECIVSSYEVFDIIKRPILKRTRLASGNYSLLNFPLTRLRKQERKVLNSSKLVNFLFNPSRTLSDYFSNEGTPDRPMRTKVSETFQKYINIISNVHGEVSSLLYGLSYVGPLRERPRRYYERSGDVPLTVGATGENAPNLLREIGSSLKKDLNRWIQAFDLASSLRTVDISEDLFEVQLVSKTPVMVSNIVDTGFGDLQLLPLIVQAITADKESLTIAEQPEIHLNPRCQSVLADLFAEMANNDKRVIVETHSEHLLLRLRRLIANKTISPSQVALYFLEKQGADTKVREVPISSDGHIKSSDWPRGFFEDSLKESLALASAQRRKVNAR